MPTTKKSFSYAAIVKNLPFIAFMFLIPENALNPTTYSGNVLGGIGGILGLIGSVSVGIGFVNIFMLLVKQYLGHLVTIISITVGLAVSAVALFVFSLVKYIFRNSIQKLLFLT